MAADRGDQAARTRRNPAARTFLLSGTAAPRRESFDEYPARPTEIRLDLPEKAPAASRSKAPVVGVSPGAAYGDAKRWLPERFAETAAEVARELGASVALFGSAAERPPLRSGEWRRSATPALKRTITPVKRLSRQFIELARYMPVFLFLTNDSGAMHIASALAVPTVTIFGATDDTTTGPDHGANARIGEGTSRMQSMPCCALARSTTRCMTRVTSQRVAAVAFDLLAQKRNPVPRPPAPGP